MFSREILHGLFRKLNWIRQALGIMVLQGPIQHDLHLLHLDWVSTVALCTSFTSGPWRNTFGYFSLFLFLCLP